MTQAGPYLAGDSRGTWGLGRHELGVSQQRALAAGTATVPWAVLTRAQTGCQAKQLSPSTQDSFGHN